MEKKEQTKSVAMIEGVVQPLMKAEELSDQLKAFQEIKKQCLTKNDTMYIKGNPYVKKTGWRKIKTAFNISLEILEKQRVVLDDKNIMWIYNVRAYAKNREGNTVASADAEMACDTREKFSNGKPETAIMAMAQTRAYNRAISDLVGGGEVSAEEMTGETPSVPEEKRVCSAPKCETEISSKVYDFSVNKYGSPFCFNCQEELKNSEEAVAESEEGTPKTSEIVT